MSLSESAIPKIDPDALTRVIEAGAAARLPVVADMEADKDAVYAEHLNAQRQEVISCVKWRKGYRNRDLGSLSTHFLRAAECGARIGLPVDDLKLLPEKRLHDIFEKTGRDHARQRRYIFNDRSNQIALFIQVPFYYSAITNSGSVLYNIVCAGIGALATMMTLSEVRDVHKKRAEYALMIQGVRDEIAQIKPLIKTQPAVVQP